MGCSPSKGKLFSKPENTRDHNLPVVQDSPENVTKPETKEENRRPDIIQETSSQRTKDEESGKPTEELTPGEGEKELLRNDKATKIEKRKKNKHKRRCSNRHRKSSLIQPKFEFPPQMVRAHQAAYSYLNPNISKYETLLGLLDQAAQTQLSLQPMMSALVMRFEEINQALEEMAEEGELMLREHGEYMAFPSGMLRSAILPAKSKTGQMYHIDPPPDLLQQLLQHSTEKMRLVGGSARALGDTTLQEATDYYASLSRVLDEKLQTKQAVERRLTLVLARVEVAAMSKSNPEDTALHSEDSGIGGENESLTGSERRHRGSAGSGSSGSGVHLRSPLGSPPNNSSNLVEDDEEEEDEEEEEEDEDENGLQRKRSNSSPPDPCHAIMYMRAKYIQQMKPTLKRPMTASTPTKPELLSSSRCANIATELQRSQRELDQRIKLMADMKELAGPHYDTYRSGLRRNSLCGLGAAPKLLPRNGSSGTAPILAPLPPRRQSVRRLINTFSQGVDGRPGQSLANVPHHIRGQRKVPLNTDGNNGNNNNNSWPDSKDDVDVDNLPPPPPEVLMDDSFQSMAGIQGNGEGPVDDSVLLTVTNQKPIASQRLRAGIQNVELLPNRANVGPRCQPTSLTQNAEDDLHLAQGRKIIHQKNESINNGNIVDVSRVSPGLTHEGVMAPSLPVTAPPVSRMRLPPSCPAVRHRYPSPPVFRPPSRPGSPKTRADRNEEIFPSVSFKDARSVFCQRESQNPSGGLGAPTSYGETSRGRMLSRRTDSSVRRTQSAQPASSTSRKQHP
ncbi:uncharacterized protein pcare2 [Synchiropus splendidus]|uniref:uncharacterized protein pcare2 n=1 Tax=Synchiropus splendidus TaxID=270530 RepID=UPI00237E103E|nr:uncharacterized protein pcare2 [Synchiropus splendidus]